MLGKSSSGRTSSEAPNGNSGSRGLVIGLSRASRALKNSDVSGQNGRSVSRAVPPSTVAQVLHARSANPELTQCFSQ